MTEDELYQIARKESPELTSYLGKRKLRDSGAIGYIKSTIYNDRVITNSILLFTRDSLGKIVQIEQRRMDNNSYNKIYTDMNAIPIFNIESVLFAETIIITESIHDAESINQNISGCVAISTNSASVKMKQILMLLVILIDKKVWIAFDNDSSGQINAKRLQEFLPNAELLDYPYNDLNEFLKKNRSLFKSYILEQII